MAATTGRNVAPAPVPVKQSVVSGRVQACLFMINGVSYTPDRVRDVVAPGAAFDGRQNQFDVEVRKFFRIQR